MHDDEITSDELGDLLRKAKTLRVDCPPDGTEVRLYVAVDPDTLHELQQRARPPRGPTSTLLQPTRSAQAHTPPEVPAAVPFAELAEGPLGRRPVHGTAPLQRWRRADPQRRRTEAMAPWHAKEERLGLSAEPRCDPSTLHSFIPRPRHRLAAQIRFGWTNWAVANGAP